MAACYGAICDEGSFDYLIGFETQLANSSDYTTLEIPTSQWAVFSAVGELPESIQNVWKSIHSNFFPSPDFDQVFEIPELEVYPDEELGESYTCTVWIPVKPKREGHPR
ncbi:MAG: GyrI-like domain-containing protein [Fimbriimonadaceae bacterium]|nr:GyrI-like domain-containing protein [Fimbriimonadaceae bacterium]